MRLSGQRDVVIALGTTQTLAWASTYYLPAMLAAPIARDLGVDRSTVFAAFSFALLISALLGPYAGRAIDRWGGRPVLMATNLVFALGLAGLAGSQNLFGLFAAWAVLGIGMGSGLYEAAFASLVRLYGHDSRNAISGITLVAGFASTVGWPLSSFLELHLGWRGACLAWAGLHAVLGLPLNSLLASATASLPHKPEVHRVDESAIASGSASAQPARKFDASAAASNSSYVILATVFAVTWFISTAMAAHLPRLLTGAGVTLAGAVAAGALVGPAQVGARLLEFSLLRHVHPLLSARLACLVHPIGAVALLAIGAPAATAFVILHGAGNGILTISKGTLPLVLFGPHGYGARQGMLMVPARLAQALAPWLFGLALDRWHLGALWISFGLAAVAFAALLLLRHRAGE